MELTHEDPKAEEATGELLREAIDQTRELVRIEVALAKDEVRRELKGIERAGIALGIASLTAVLALATLLAVVVVVLGWLAGLIIGGALLVLAGAFAAVGAKQLPTKPLATTRKRLERDVHGLKERMA